MHCLNARYGVLDAPPFTRNWNADNFVDVYFRFRCVFQNNTAILNNIHEVKLSLTTLYSTWQHQLTYLNRQAKRCFFFNLHDIIIFIRDITRESVLENVDLKKQDRRSLKDGRNICKCKWYGRFVRSMCKYIEMLVRKFSSKKRKLLHYYWQREMVYRPEVETGWWLKSHTHKHEWRNIFT